MRIGGLASGMDTEQIIKDLMKAQRIPLDKITQKKQYLEWQLDDYRSANRKLFDFSSNTFDNMIMSTNFTKKNVTVSSDEVAIKNISSSAEFTGTIEVHQLAKNATLQGGQVVHEKLTSEQVSTTRLSDLGIGVPSSGFITMEIKTPGEEKAKKVTVSVGDSIGAVIAQINEKTGVTAFFDQHTGKIAMSSKNSGEGDIEVTGELATALKINTVENSEVIKQAGQNAIFSFNGLQTERSSNTFQINGFEMNLKQVTAPLKSNVKNDKGLYEIAEGGKSVSFNSSPDTDKIFESIVKYVDDYNKLIEELNKKIREPKYRSYQPLSAEQKSEMKEKEIELWEEKAKSGTLRNDSEISSLLNKMRSSLMTSVEVNGKKMTLKDIGITTSSDYLDYGKLVIKEEDLKKAIAENPNAVHQLFAKETSKGEDGKETTGLARQLREAVDTTQKTIAERAGKAGSGNKTFLLGRTLDDMNKQIERFEDRLKMVENRYWKQFTAMENAIQRANAQSANMMNMFGGQ
ncbi:flagellar hook-associated protein 2 [Sporosarcina sp. NCCP-2222]|uniref:flagellar hook-associated protein 2 n=1 Tax=Sporosarcina sp. NCCP-2222 TaxID=2935073 RepID=UPI002089FC15|nr:flagellar hook-associated protein 2 [Sporosarcina sp. NCCP-2222]GKV56683.1 flagellar hook-associated protein 2 [Sporosarcina sp. NCCP-2222]